MLDNLGIIVDVARANENYAKELGTTASKLTEAERKQAFINEALAQGKDLVEGIGVEVQTSAQKIETFTSTITNLKTSIGEAFIESGALDTLIKYSSVLLEMADNYIEANRTAAENANISKELAEDYLSLIHI